VTSAKLSSALQVAIAKIDELEAQVASLQSILSSLQSSVDAHDAVLSFFSVTEVPDPNTPSTTYDTILLTGANLQIVNGDNAANTLNGLGNLIIGYNQGHGFILQGGYTALGVAVCSDPRYTDQTDCENNEGTWSANHRRGSHNLVIGPGHSYGSQGALIAGMANRSLGEGASVTGGYDNMAYGWNANVSGGLENTASGSESSINGGRENTADGPRSSLLGGQINTASGGWEAW